MKGAVLNCFLENDDIDQSKLDKIIDQIMPCEEWLGEKTLVISRNLCLIETMAHVYPHLEKHLQKKNIPYHFDFAISETPHPFLGTSGATTTTKEYYANLKIMEQDPNTTVWKGKAGELNMHTNWLSPLKGLDLNFYMSPSRREIKDGLATYEKNDNNKHLLNVFKYSDL